MQGLPSGYNRLLPSNYKIAKCMYLGPEKNDRRQVNKKFRKLERKYRDFIKRNRDKIGTQTCYDISTYA